MVFTTPFKHIEYFFGTPKSTIVPINAEFFFKQSLENFPAQVCSLAVLLHTCQFDWSKHGKVTQESNNYITGKGRLYVMNKLPWFIALCLSISSDIAQLPPILKCVQNCVNTWTMQIEFMVKYASFIKFLVFFLLMILFRKK